MSDRQKPGTLQPGTLQPGTLQPGTLQPGTLQPGTLQPSTLQPSTLQPSTLPDRYFDDVYAAHDDPWSFETSPYEAAKYERTLLALTRDRYGSALEIGCSIGVFSARLAQRCDRLLALDVSQQALERARARCADLSQTHFERRRLPQQFPAGQFDLIVASEVLYYLGHSDLQATLERCLAALPAGGELLCVHWTPQVHDYPQTGDEVHAAVFALPGLIAVHAERHAQYRLDLFRRS